MNAGPRVRLAVAGAFLLGAVVANGEGDATGGGEAELQKADRTNAVGLSEIVVTAPNYLGETGASTHLDARSVREAAGPAASSPWKAIADTPSIHFQNSDPYGLTEVGFHETVRIRGVGQTGPASSRNIDDLPITVNPGGSKGILDMENVAAIDVYRGAPPVDKALGFSNLPGKINVTTQGPRPTADTRVELGGGSDGFQRYFLRQDIGQRGAFSGFLSASESQGDNWKGEGEFDRQNLFSGVALDGGEFWRAEVYGGYNKDERNTYRFFDYAKASDFSNYGRDWSDNPTSVDYYDYNRQSFEDCFVYANLLARLTDDLNMVIKPYYLTESGDYWFSSINNSDPTKSRVIDWMIDHDNIGALTRLDWQANPDQEIRSGIWVQSQEPPGPPATQRKYRVTPSGLAFDGWQVLADNERHSILSPFVTYLGEFDAFKAEVGLRYVNLRLGELTAYKGTGGAAQQYDVDAALEAGGVDPMASASSRTLDEFLPCLGLAWEMDPDTSLFTRLGRTYGLDVNLFPYYYLQKDQFARNGVSFQSLWDQLELETADQLDLGVRRERENWQGGVTAFYALHRNKQSTVYDPAAGVRYPWNTADASRYGVELEGTVQLDPRLSLFGNYCWNRFRYDQDLALSSSSVIASDGKQVVDAPEHMVKLGTRYDVAAWRLGLNARYLGSRYGDVLNEEQVDDVVLTDASVSYRFSPVVTLTVDVLNLFDTEYIGPINAADDAIANYTAALNGVTGNGASYQYGSPRTLFVGLSAQF